MFKYIDDLDKKNKNLSNLAILPGFNIIENKFLKENYNTIFDTESLITRDKKIIEENIFSKFFASIDKSEKKNTRKKQYIKKTKSSRKK